MIDISYATPDETRDAERKQQPRWQELELCADQMLRKQLMVLVHTMRWDLSGQMPHRVTDQLLT